MEVKTDSDLELAEVKFQNSIAP